MDAYEQSLGEWLARMGVVLSSAVPAVAVASGELRMMAEDARASGKSYCWLCAEEFPIREMVIETSPYNQMEDDPIGEDGYIAKKDRVRKCKACAKREEDEQKGIEEGAEP